MACVVSFPSFLAPDRVPKIPASASAVFSSKAALRKVLRSRPMGHPVRRCGPCGSYMHVVCAFPTRFRQIPIRCDPRQFFRRSIIAFCSSDRNESLLPGPERRWPWTKSPRAVSPTESPGCCEPGEASRSSRSRRSPGPWRLVRRVGLVDRAVANSTGSGIVPDLGEITPHAFDPRTGRSPDRFAGVAIAAPAAIEADAPSTALNGVSSERVETLMTRLSGKEVVLTPSGGRVVEWRARILSRPCALGVSRRRRARCVWGAVARPRRRRGCGRVPRKDRAFALASRRRDLLRRPAPAD